ncbi:MAG TPA: hypothetical protein EYP10_07155 [Armatimonadetes bacterium]|nr:hypothetical protein [Armatimonadota bacterium]
MHKLADVYADDFTVYTASGFGRTRNDGLATEDCPSDWAVGSDEIGNLVYDEAAISDFLRQDNF